MPVTLQKSKNPDIESLELKDPEDVVAGIQWPGPGLLNISPKSECQAICKVKVVQSIDKSILVVDQPYSSKSPADVLVKPTIIPSSAIQVNKFPVLLKNVSQKDVCLPAVSVVALGYTTEVATNVERDDSAKRIQASLTLEILQSLWRFTC